MDSVRCDCLHHMFIQTSRYTLRHEHRKIPGNIFCETSLASHLCKKCLCICCTSCYRKCKFRESICKQISTIVHRIPMLFLPIFFHIQSCCPLFIILYPFRSNFLHSLWIHPRTRNRTDPITTYDCNRHI